MRHIGRIEKSVGTASQESENDRAEHPPETPPIQAEWQEDQHGRHSPTKKDMNRIEPSWQLFQPTRQRCHGTPGLCLPVVHRLLRARESLMGNRGSLEIEGLRNSVLFTRKFVREFSPIPGHRTVMQQRDTDSRSQS